jgi:hypothetical protein
MGAARILLGIAGVAIMLVTACNRRTDGPQSSSAVSAQGVDIKFHASFIPDFDLLRWNEGQRLLFLPVAGPMRASLKGKYPGWDALYEEMAGKVGRVLSCKEDSNDYKTVRVQMEDSGKMFRGTSHTVSLDEQVILARNYEVCRTHVLGKTLWVRETGAAPYDEQTKARKGDYSISTPIPGRLEPVQVTDVVLTEAKRTPLRLLLLWNGAKYFQDVGFDDAPFDFGEIRHLYRIQDTFLDVDPLSFHWSEGVLSAIKERRIVIGMSAEQVLLSWGEPKKKNRTVTASGTSEQWVYPVGQYAYLDNGVLTSMQGAN